MLYLGLMRCSWGKNIFAMWAWTQSSSAPMQMPGMATYACNSNTGIGGSRQIPGAHWSVSLPGTDLQIR